MSRNHLQILPHGAVKQIPLAGSEPPCVVPRISKGGPRMGFDQFGCLSVSGSFTRRSTTCASRRSAPAEPTLLLGSNGCHLHDISGLLLWLRNHGLLQL